MSRNAAPHRMLGGNRTDVATTAQGVLRSAADAVLAQQGRWPLWLPVGLGLGIGAYFSLGEEPAAWLGPAALAAALLGWLATRDVPRIVMAAVLSVALGFAAAQFRTAAVETPIVPGDTGAVRVEGRVAGIDRLDKGVRVLLEEVRVSGLPAAETPVRVRIRLKAGEAAPEPGSRIRLLAVLQPPPEPVEPGAYDFRMHAYFLRIGGVGFALTRAEGRPQAEPGFWQEVRAGLEELRHSIALRVEDRLDGASAGVTTALLNGEPTAIPENDLEALRLSGLQHLLSISGLHIGLVAGLVFLAVRALLALIPAVALHRPIKKWAAAIALVAAFAYMGLVGAPVPTQRAVMMTGIMLLAVMVDRNPFSLRVVAVAAGAVLLTQPESMLGPSFQMSFAAVVALIAAYEWASPALAEWRAEAGPIRKALFYVVSLSLTSLVASLATVPFSLYHFQQMANYGLLANLLAVPVTSFWVMPCGLLAYLLMPLGLEGPALHVMGLGVEVILWTAHAVAAMPGASAHLPAMPLWALILASLGGIWLCLWLGWIRLLGLFGIGAMGLALLSPSLPDVRVSAGGKLVGVRLPDGSLSVSSARAGRFEAEEWHQRDGNAGAPAAWPAPGTADGVVRCDSLGCMYAPTGKPAVAIIRSGEALAEDCGRAAVVITTVEPKQCAAAVVIGPAELQARGAHAFYFDGGTIRVETVRPRRGARPWN